MQDLNTNPIDQTSFFKIYMQTHSCGFELDNKIMNIHGQPNKNILFLDR